DYVPLIERRLSLRLHMPLILHPLISWESVNDPLLILWMMDFHEQLRMASFYSVECSDDRVIFCSFNIQFYHGRIHVQRVDCHRSDERWFSRDSIVTRIGHRFIVETVSHWAAWPIPKGAMPILVADSRLDDFNVSYTIAVKICSQRFGRLLCRLYGYDCIVVSAGLESPHATVSARVYEQVALRQYRLPGKVFSMVEDRVPGDKESVLPFTVDDVFRDYPTPVYEHVCSDSCQPVLIRVVSNHPSNRL